MDLWVNQSEENYFKLKKVYKEFGAPIFSLEEFFNDTFDVWSMGIEPRKIEILTKVSGLNFLESKSHCNWILEENFKVPYIDFEDLMKNKLASGRLKDLLDFQQLSKKRNS